MTKASSYRIEIAACPANPRYYRWAVFRDDRRLDLPGYAYATAWAAGEAARVALHWHLALNPFRSRRNLEDCPPLHPVAASATRNAA